MTDPYSTPPAKNKWRSPVNSDREVSHEVPLPIEVSPDTPRDDVKKILVFDDDDVDVVDAEMDDLATQFKRILENGEENAEPAKRRCLGK